MKRVTKRRGGGIRRASCVSGIWATPALSHHSFAMYDQTKVVTFTGVVTRFVAQPNHAEIHFVPLGTRRGNRCAAPTASSFRGASRWPAPPPWPTKALP